jgi:predicted ATPase/DNA-binding XRE family transcriptional regulator
MNTLETAHHAGTGDILKSCFQLWKPENKMIREVSGMAGAHQSAFGKILRTFRLRAGLSQEELAARAELSVRGVSNLERGLRTSPRPDTVRMLAEALALSPEDRAALIAAAHPELGATPAAEPTSTVAASRPVVQLLVAPPTRLVGRDRDIDQLTSLLRREEVRLVTLTGPGGVGKTRLALAAAAALGGNGRFRDRVAMVALAPVRDLALVASAIAASLGIAERGGRPLSDVLADTIRERHLLLVLDNFEHVAPAAALVADLLARCPGLAVLATSRERLHLRGEHEVPVVPLALPPPDTDGHVSLTRLVNVPAVRLFVERAEETAPTFSLTDENAAVIAELCRRLDGLPLAIELAAARLTMLPPRALLDRLGHRLQVLTGGPRDLPERQQTLRDTIAWSYDLLTPIEQQVFRAIATFSGGFTLEAFEEVCGPLVDPDVEALDALGSLVDKSLVRMLGTADSEPRYLVLETIREFAEERLVASGEEQMARQRHAAWCLGITSDAPSPLRRVTQPAELVRLAGEHANLRAALTWLERSGDTAAFLTLAANLGYFWYLTGHLPEGLDWLNRALAAATDETTTEYVDALLRAGHLAQTLGKDEATAYLRRGRALARAAGDIEQEAHAAVLLGILSEDSGDYREAEALLTRGRELAERTGLSWAAVCAGYHLGVIAYGRGELARSRAMLESAQAAGRAIDDVLIPIWCLPYLALIACEEHDLSRAAGELRQALWYEGAAGLRRGDENAFGAAAVLADALGEWEAAARLLGAATVEFHDAPFPLPERTAFTRAEASARHHLDASIWAEAWSAGRHMRRDAVRAEVDRVTIIGEGASAPEAEAG